MEKKFRSSCNIASALDLIGDKWSLLIVRDMLLVKKKTFKEFASSDEKVATNLLSSRLKLLETINVISKRKFERNKKENIYLLTERGIDLAPLIMELVLWSEKYVREYNHEMNELRTGMTDKNIVIENTQNRYRAFAQQILQDNSYSPN